MSLWEPPCSAALREKGKGAHEGANLFEAHIEEGKDFAYGLAEEIKDELASTETDSRSVAVNEEDRERRLTFNMGHARGQRRGSCLS